MRAPTQPVTVRLPVDLVEQLDALAAADDRTRTSLITKALRLYIEAQRQDAEEAA